MSQTCPYCREFIAEPDLVACPACHTPHHHDCWLENGGCTVFGCEHAPTDDPKIAISSNDISGAGGGPYSSVPSYYISRDGQPQGPYTLEHLRRETHQGTILQHDLAWAEGMPNWIPLSQLLGTMSGFSPPLAPTPHVPPFQPSQYPVPTATRTLSFQQSVNDPCAGRMKFGRGLFLLSLVALIFLAGALGTSKETADLGMSILWLGIIPVSVLRVRDIGMSGWSVLWTIVPIGNLFLWFRLLLAPRGYAITKQTDLVLRVFTWIFVAIFVLGILAAIIGSLNNR